MSHRPSVVQLINATTGRQSSILAAPAFLQANINAHIQRRKAQNLSPLPSLMVVHTTHYLCLSTAFKPCVICAFEYVRTVETLNNGSTTEIELKQNCDYINDMYIEVDTPVVQCDSVTLPDIVVRPKDLDVYSANGNRSLNFGTGLINTASEESTAGLVNVVDGFNYVYDPIGAVYTNTTITNVDGKQYTIRVASLTEPHGGISYTYVDQDGNFIAGPNGQAVNPGVNGFGAGQGSRVSRANYVKAADFIGLKYFHSNIFKVDDNNISEYHSMALINFRERRLTPTIRRTFDRLVGQEEAFEQISENHTATGKTASGFAAGGAQAQYGRHHTRVANGLQTPKPVQPSQKLYIPCIHWFNVERKTSLPVVCMPDGKLVISVQNSPIDHLFFPAPGLYIQETVYAYSVAGGANGTQADPHIVLNRRIPYIIPGSRVTQTDCNRNVTLVTCNILLDELIHMMIISRIGFNLITLIREENLSVTTPEPQETLKVNQLKWPTEYLHLNDQPVSNYDHRLPDSAENWWRCGFQSKYDASDYLHFTRRTPVAGPANQFWKESLQQGCKYERHVENVIHTLGVNIYDTYFFAKENRREFYSQYLPYAYSNGFIAGDTQHNSIFVTFANIPGPYQPSGFVNLSKTKEMFLDVTVNPSISITNKARINIQSWCRNFLLIADGSCIVRFS